MGFSVATPLSPSALFAEIALAEGQENNHEIEETLLSQEFGDADGAKETQEGFLKGESKQYSFVKQEGLLLPQQLQDSLTHLNPSPKHRPFDLNDPKTSSKHLTKTREFKTVDKSTENLYSKQLGKIHLATQQALKNGKAPQSAQQLKETGASRQQQTQAKTLENKLHKQFSVNTNHHSDSKKDAAKEQPHIENRHVAQEHQESFTRTRDKEEERQQQQSHKEHEEEEGFAGGGQNAFYQEEQREKEEKHRVGKIDEAYVQQFVNYSAQESILSEIFNMRISQFDVLILFMEILKLEIQGREQERIARQQERELQLVHMQKVVDNYKDQSTWTKWTSIGSGILAIISGACPIIGHMKGDWILGKLQGFFDSLQGMKQDQLFKSFTKITFAMSEMQKNTGQIHSTFSEGNRTFDQHMSDLHRSEWEEQTRNIDEIKDSWKGIENFLYQTLQMYHDAIRQLYNA